MGRYVFAYKLRERNVAASQLDRDACCYVDLEHPRGTHGTSVCGPCFNIRFGHSFNGAALEYDDVDTLLSEEEYYRARDEGVDDAIVAKLIDTQEMAEAEFLSSELGILAERLDISLEDAERIFAASCNFRDRGVCEIAFRDWDEAADEEAWQLGYSDQPYFDKEAFKDDLMKNSAYLQLPSGRVARLNDYYDY